MWLFKSIILLICVISSVGCVEDELFYDLVNELAKWQATHPLNRTTNEYVKNLLSGSKYSFQASLNMTENVNNSIFTIQGKDKVPKWSFSTGIFANKAQEMGYQDCREIAKYKKRPITIIETEPEVEEQKPAAKPKKPKKPKAKPKAPPQWLLESSSSEEESEAGEPEMNFSGSESDEDSDVSEGEGKHWFLGLSVDDNSGNGRYMPVHKDALVAKVGNNFPGLYLDHHESLLVNGTSGSLKALAQAKRGYTEDDYIIEAENFEKEMAKLDGNPKFKVWQVKHNINTSDVTKKVANFSSTSVASQLLKAHLLSESKASRMLCIFGLYCF